MSGQQLEQSWRIRGWKTTHLFPHIHTFFSVKLRFYGFVYNKSLSDKIWLYLVRHTNSSNMPWLSPSKNFCPCRQGPNGDTSQHKALVLSLSPMQSSLEGLYFSVLAVMQSELRKVWSQSNLTAQSLGSAWGSVDACCQHKGPDVSPLRLLEETLRPLTLSLIEWDHIPMKWVGS